MSISDRILVTLAVLALLSAPILGAIPRQRIAAQPLCWSVIFFHRECAGCGLTRSFAAIGRGSLAEANQFNPLGPILFGWAAAVAAIRLGRMARPSPWWVTIDVAFACAAVIALVTRLVTFYFG
ncbi:MAG: DUF2752 domain-containing protein [Thermoanaerobaculia bacterium]